MSIVIGEEKDWDEYEHELILKGNSTCPLCKELISECTCPDILDKILPTKIEVIPNSYCVKQHRRTVADVFSDELVIDGSFSYQDWEELKATIDDIIKNKKFADR